MPKRGFLALTDFSRGEIQGLMDRAAELKAGARTQTALAGKALALLFAKSSTRTRVSFEIGMYQLGGHALFLSSRDLQLGRGEPIEDTARVLSRYVDGMMIRTFAHAEAEELATHATVPVINGLTDLLHPCQLLADLFTMREVFGGWEDRIVAWVGDGNNMANSWLNAAGLLGFELRLACPGGFEPNHHIYEAAKANTGIRITVDPEEAVRGAHVVNTDVWASMGQEDEREVRKLSFQGYTVTRELMSLAAKDAIFLHCLPAHRGEEVEEAVLEGPQSRVFQQAENRLHVQKALLLELLS
jgi:ornithine carbamoyltransferase